MEIAKKTWSGKKTEGGVPLIALYILLDNFLTKIPQTLRNRVKTILSKLKLELLKQGRLIEQRQNC